MGTATPRGPFGRTWTVGLVVIDPVGVLLDAAAAERARWRWWAGRVGADPDAVLADAAARPSAAVVARHAPDADPAAEVTALAARQELLLRTVRRTRGAASLLRALPRGRAALWTRADEDELARLLRRARIAAPGPTLTGLGGPDAAARAAAFLADLGQVPHRVAALEGGPAGAARSAALGCRTAMIGRAAAGAAEGAATAGGGGIVRLHDIALVGVRPDADGVTVSLRRESRLR